MNTPATCPVCRGGAPSHFQSINTQVYWRCNTCEATFLDPSHDLTPEDELAYYQLHENDSADPRYRDYLSKLANPLLQKLKAPMHGLDYGCGPGPALAIMLREVGHTVELYDPFFQPDPAPLTKSYDFIVCTETAEHFHNPADEFDRLNEMLKPGGWLGLMTCFQTEDERFSKWHYRNDPTHVVFYRQTTLELMARQRGWSCEVPVKDIALMQKPGPS